jgi:DNA-binding NarL/FixJ family response regulator
MADQVRVLLVEDSQLTLRATARALRSKGFAVEVARSCAEARLQGRHFDTGVFDIHLGDGSGVELAQAMTFNRQVEHAVFYTGGTCQQVLRRAVRLGPVVPKSEGVEVLVSVVRAALRGELAVPRPARAAQRAVRDGAAPADWG